ncbi:uncharacterized protein BDR25DRAFT_321331 [Lindgomyces ingoldianus]|uniref:Uncharacterized protein n=1 Tax=Lindgomyces ingoldianus TaxID=673940 RepID=A0ACB6RGM9_9PLEO|nr:uncharacterized protein BDR25DRAFT_321331 [Lindgomyces ingoldianus]KAF2478271.1 hypothetical protein BDR25DRAFT_321331 [Lindgomyces ingoldianus]
MPTIPNTRDLPAPQPDSLAPRDPGVSSLLSREPALEVKEDTVIALNALEGRSFNKRDVVPGIIPTYYSTSGPTPGTVVGIVLGSVAGFLLIVWLLWSLTNLSGRSAIAGEEEIVVRRRRGSHSPHSRRSRRSTRTEVREFSRSPRRREHIIVDERRAGPPPPRARSIIVEERIRVPNDDVVEVIEEHDDYRTRRGSRRSGNYR